MVIFRPGAFLLTLVAALGACGAEAEEPDARERAAAGCSAGLAIRIDEASFAPRDGGPPLAPDELKRFARAAGGAFKAAADHMCRDARLDPARLAGYRSLLIQSGSGASETAIYDAAGPGGGALVFQWTFVEEELRLPDSRDIQDGLTCWADPTTAMCAERLP